MIEGVIGLILAGVTIYSSRIQNYEHWMYSVVLISLPLIYMGFGIFSDSNEVILKELIYGLPFLFVGLGCFIFGFKGSGYIVAIFWLLHGAYDLAHDKFFINSGVPVWYPVFCAAVDVVIGIYLLVIATKIPNSNIKLAVKNA